jgi:hypothetical protein
MEEYRLCVDCNGYSVSNLGNVRNDAKNKILKQSNCNGYKIVGINGTTIGVHRLIANAFIDNPTNKLFVDHINNNRSDNRIENLRWVTSKENMFNMSLSKRNKSGSKGVYWDNSRQKWQVHITIDNVNTHLGRYTNIEDAIEVRINKAKEVFGEFINKCEVSNDLSNYLFI